MLEESAVTWWKWLLAGAAGGAIAVYLLTPPPPVKEVIKIHEVVKWKTVEHIRTLPGTVTVLKPDGSTEITGRIEFTRSSEGGVTRDTEHQRESDRPSWRVLVSAGALLPRPAFQLGMDYRIGLLFNKIGIGAGVLGEWPFGSYVPTRGGVRLILTF